MNKELWDKVLAYDFDYPISEYGFSTRLAKENYWTIDFTAKAILEYKKFMYLAATSDLMVSPSGIVDVVWHQHLVFTKSYNEFCEILGKIIQHVPSTHNQVEFERFKQAKERTKKLYHTEFGEMPEEVWNYSSMYDCLKLPKAKWKLRTFILVGILGFMALIYPSYLLLRPFYIKIASPDFMFAFISISALTFIGLRIYNRQYLGNLIKRLHLNTFIFRLNPSELIYIKTQNLSNVVHGTIDNMIKEKKINVVNKSKLEIVEGSTPASLEEFQVMDVFSHEVKTNYDAFLKKLTQKPVFSNVANSMDALKKYFNKSIVFGRLFYLNFGLMAVVLMLGFIRFLTGLLRDKPTDIILFTLSIFVFLTLSELARLTKITVTRIIPDVYRNQIIPAGRHTGKWEDWQYFLLGTAFLSPSFMPMIKKESDISSASCGTSDGSSCGSSCSSCGGCGGD